MSCRSQVFGLSLAYRKALWVVPPVALSPGGLFLRAALGPVLGGGPPGPSHWFIADGKNTVKKPPDGSNYNDNSNSNIISFERPL